MRHDLGVLFVHGIGSQTQGRTLADWGQVVTGWISRWMQAAGTQNPAATIRDASLVPVDQAPAHAFVDVRYRSNSDEITSHWMLAEAWWAGTVLPPSFSELARWSTVVVPWTIASHFMIRLRRNETTKNSKLSRLISLALSFFSLLAAMVAMPLLMVGIALILALGVIPIRQLRELAGAAQRALANTLGDSLVLLGNSVQEAAIVGRVRRDLEWLSPQCKKVVVLAHSQGAAVAHLALQQTHVENVTLFVSFGSGIAKLVETRRLMTSQDRNRWAPWLLSLAAVCLFLGVWKSLPGLWATLDTRGLLCVLGYFVFVGLASVSRFPAWLRGGLLILALLALLAFMWPWFDRSAPWLYTLIAGTLLFAFGVPESSKEATPRPPKVGRWLDLYASRDPVPNGPLFERVSETAGVPLPEHKPRRKEKSAKVFALRSSFSDHTAYWMSADDFVPRIVANLASEAGIKITCARGDLTRLARARARRRWRTVLLGLVRAAMLVSPLVILSMQGVAVSIPQWHPTEQATETPVGIALQRNATEAVVDILGTLTPDVLKPWIGAQGRGVSQAVATSPADDSSYVRVMNGTASLTLLALIVWIAFVVVEWQWRAWDNAEVARLFERKDYRVLEPQFVVFLFTTILVLELVGFLAAGWMAHLRDAPNRLLGLMMTAALLVALIAAIPWIFKAAWSLRSAPQKALGLFNRGLCAALVAFISVLPAFVAIGAGLVGRDVNELDNAAFMEPVGWWILLVLLIVWVVPMFGLWSRVEQFVARRTSAKPFPPSAGS